MNTNSFLYKFRTFRIKLFNWEYWSFNVVYTPVYFHWLWLSIKARSFFFFSTSNPTIENAGFVMESKKAIYDIMPKSFYPKTILLEINHSKNDIEENILKNNLVYPLVAKPNIGERGNAVKKMFNIEDILLYQKNTNVPFLVQEWCSYQNEIGVFYCKFPTEEKGFISGIVKKEFFTIKGNGINTIEELLVKDDRYFLQHKTLKETLPNELKIILKKDEEKILVPYGNHCRGTKFLDFSYIIDEDLNNAFNEICNQIPGFYFGRMDIRFESLALLKQAKSFSIIELNGAGSEPTHIYDPKHSIFFAWKEIIKHLNILFKISQQNRHLYNKSFMSFADGLKMLKNKKTYDKLINLKV